MQVQVLYFGVLKDVLRRDREQFELLGAASVDHLLTEIRKTEARVRGDSAGGDLPWNSIAIAVNRVYAHRDYLLAEGDEVALLPPVSGGSQTPERAV